MRRLAPYLVAAGLVVLVKGLLALSLADVFFHGEELEKGTAAKALLDGIPVARHQIAYHYYEGGGFVISHLTAIAFTLVGENLLAHKLVSLLVNIAIACVGVAFVSASFGRRSAYVFAVLYSLGPVGFQKLSLLNLGIHYETSLFLLLAFHLGLRLALSERAGPRTALGLGAALGFGVFFNFQMIPAGAFVVVAVLVLRRRALLGPSAVFLLTGVLLGAMPMIFMVATVGGAVFDIHGTPLFGGEGAEEIDRAGRLAEFGAWLAEDAGVLGIPVLALRFVLPVAGALYLIRVGADGHEGDAEHRRSRRTALALIAYLTFFLVTYLASPFVVGDGFRHFRLQRLTPFWMLGTVLTAGVVGALISSASGRRRGAGAALFAVLVVAGLDATREALVEGQPGTLGSNLELLRRTRGYTYPEYFSKLVGKLPGTEAEQLWALTSFDEPRPEILYAAAAESLYRRSEEPTSEILRTLIEADPERWPSFVHGLGPHFLELDNGMLRRALSRAAGLSDELRPHAFEAIGRSHHWRIRPDELAQDLTRVRGLSLPYAYYRGFGHRLYRGFRLDPAAAAQLIAESPAEHRAQLTRAHEEARKLFLLP